MQTQAAIPQEYPRVPLGSISPQPGFNPRRFFDPVALSRLAETIRKQGVLQPITLRPRHDGEEGFWLVAGERRWRASSLAGLTDIPALVRDLDDTQALIVATVENQDRENISAAEEVSIARRAVDACSGDVQQASDLLDWSESKVKARLLLLNATDEVLAAVSDKTIALGHAELLSTLTPDVQKRVLASVITNKASVELLRTQLASFTQELEHAPFDTEGCKTCPNNSSLQASLFDFHVGQGRCSNKPCWDDKREKALELKKTEVLTEVPMAFFDKEKDPATYIRLETLGPRGVGAEQAEKGCKGCAKFGAIISTRPGSERKVTYSQCFDRACNQQMVEDYQASLPPAPVAADAASPAVPAKSKAPVKAAKKKVSASNASPGSPRRVLETIWAFFRAEAVKEVTASTRLTNACALYALMKTNGKTQGDTEKAFEKILALTDEQIAEQIAKGAIHMIENQKEVSRGADVWERVSVRILKDRQVELPGRYKLTEEFFSAHTKSGLEALLAEANFVDSLEGKDEGERKKKFKKLMGMKSGEIVAAAIKHDFGNFVPSEVEKQFKKPSER